ncbi:MAG: hypothetical protein CSA62_11180 [Planctomycetota bacterium]|nr:MAG: hypothetical protein CSA62_11180 [Planctomycetota bacterium]
MSPPAELLAALEGQLADSLHLAKQALADSEACLAWDPLSFESALDSWQQGPGRLLELLRRLRDEDALQQTAIASGLDAVLRKVRSQSREPQVLARAALPTELDHASWPRWVFELLTELLLEISSCLGPASELRLLVGLREWSVELVCDSSPLNAIGQTRIAGALLRMQGCASLQSGPGRWLLAWASPLGAMT